MNGANTSNPVARRSFLARLTAGATALGLTGSTKAQAQTAPGLDWRPTAHPEDDWFAELPGQHRFFFDTTTSAGLGTGMLYANNYFVANRTGYNIGDEDLAVVICLRHFSTPFAFSDAMWAKYGSTMAPMIGTTSSGTNPRLSSADPSEPGGGVTLEGLIGRGVHFAVCDMATTFFAGTLARATGGSAEAVHAELVANRIGNAHMVSAGIVAVNRAQERGYSFAYVG
jgi:intracellular sulfur oxidation DsrE/DsrF family protein